MHDVQHIKHNYSENREVCVFSSYQFYLVKNDTDREIVSLELREELLKNILAILPSMFEANIEQKLKEGEDSGEIEFNTLLYTSNGLSNFIVVVDWLVGDDLDVDLKKSFDHVENFEYYIDIEVQIEATIELNNQQPLKNQYRLHFRLLHY